MTELTGEILTSAGSDGADVLTAVPTVPVATGVGRIRRVPLREVWRHEALGFTTWLRENVDVLNEVLGLSLQSAEREQSAGAFSVDLVADDGSDDPVIIENQLEKSDHDHLGKLITYLAALEAKKVIWIVAEPRPEHIRAITWLNQSTAASFYMLKLEAIRIGDSPAAPLLTLIVGPSEEGREAGEKKREFVERHDIRQRFWAAFLELARTRKMHTTISPSRYNWIGSGISTPRGLNLNYSVRQHEATAELYIDRGKEADDESKRIFDRLVEVQEQIEGAFGEPLEWQRLEDRRACRIAHTVRIGGYRDEAMWPQVHEAMLDAMTRLERALRPHFSKVAP
jgi:hypothetical protein